MPIKTDLELLEGQRNSARAMVLQADINITRLKTQLIIVKPGNVYEEVKKVLNKQEMKKEVSEEVLKIIDKMIITEKKKGAKNG